MLTLSTRPLPYLPFSPSCPCATTPQDDQSEIDPETLECLRADFDALDKDKSGTLELSELKGF